MLSRSPSSAPSVTVSSISARSCAPWPRSDTTATRPSSRTGFPERDLHWTIWPQASRRSVRRRNQFPDDEETRMPRIDIRYDSSLVDGAKLATLMVELAEMGARQYFTTPEKVVVELFEQSPYTLG